MIDTVVNLIIILIIAFLFVFALYWEVLDFVRVEGITPVRDITEEDRIKAISKLACIEYENGVGWRIAFIGATLVTLILMYAFNPETLCWKQWLLVLVITFIIFYGLACFRIYHYNRLICNKARQDMIIL